MFCRVAPPKTKRTTAIFVPDIHDPANFVLEYEEQDSYYNATPRLSPSSTAYSATPRNFTPRTPRPPHAPPQGVRAIIRRKTWDGKVDQEAFEHVLAGAQHKP